MSKEKIGSEVFYKSGTVNRQGRELVMTRAAKVEDDIKKVATSLYVAGYHTNNTRSYEHYWIEASDFVAFCKDKIKAYYEKAKKEADNIEKAKKETEKEAKDIVEGLK